MRACENVAHCQSSQGPQSRNQHIYRANATKEACLTASTTAEDNSQTSWARCLMEIGSTDSSTRPAEIRNNSGLAAPRRLPVRGPRARQKAVRHILPALQSTGAVTERQQYRCQVQQRNYSPAQVKFQFKPRTGCCFQAGSFGIPNR